MQFIKKSYDRILCAFLFVLLLSEPVECAAFTKKGLLIWFQIMIPSLFPFMLLTSFMVQTGAHTAFSKAVSPLLKPLFRVSNHGIYVILCGFLCGFPLGAKTISELYEKKLLSETEGEYLLSFCNNIGPVYLMSVVLPFLEKSRRMPCFLLFYAVPFFYGIVLRHTIYRKRLPLSHGNSETTKKEIPAFSQKEDCSFFALVDTCLMKSLFSITCLGGYMILFQFLAVIPSLFFKNLPLLNLLSNGILEISSGAQAILNAPFSLDGKILLLFPLLAFTGFSCLAQTATTIKNTTFSLKPYLLHKGIQSGICFALLYFFVV